MSLPTCVHLTLGAIVGYCYYKYQVKPVMVQHKQKCDEMDEEHRRFIALVEKDEIEFEALAKQLNFKNKYEKINTEQFK